MTIHGTHPFLDPESERDPVRRLRGRLGGAVSLWTTGTGRDRAGLTVSSLMVVAGEPGRVLALVDPDSGLSDALGPGSPAVVQLLAWRHRDLADAFAGTAPAPGGPFAQATWTETAWGPVLSDATSWAGVRVESLHEVGWSRLVTAVLEHAEVGEDDDPLTHRRGRYQRPIGPTG